MATVSFEAKGKWESNGGPGKFKANTTVKGSPVTVFAEFDPRTGALKNHYRTMTAALKDNESAPKVGKIVVTVTPLVGKGKVTEHDL